MVIVRLSLQKQNGSPTLPVATDDKVDPAASTGELLTLRGDDKPYTGVYVRVSFIPLTLDARPLELLDCPDYCP